MNSELKKRIKTSIILLGFTIFCIFSHIGIFIIAVLVISSFAFIEISSINYRIMKNSLFLINSLCLIYLFAIFATAALSLYKLLGPSFFLYILSICFFSDIGGYFVGKKIGGKKITKISPNKTISGSIGSFLFSIFPLLIFNIFHENENLFSVNNFLFCLELSLVCQLGDLFISFLKRKAKIKDTGKILPGHGGLLDRIDGIIFAIPFAYIYTIGFSNYFKLLF